VSVRAVVMVEPGQLALREFDDPVLEEGTALVRLVLTGVCGTDRHVYEGHLPLDFPVIPGHENLGVVEEIRGEFKDAMGDPLSVGDRIVWDAGFEACGECYYCKWLPSNYGATFCEKGRAYGFENCDRPPHLLGGWAEKAILVPGTAAYRVPEVLTDEEALLVDPLASASGVERAVFHCSWLGMGLGFGQTVVIQGSGTVGVLAAVKAQLLGATRTLMVGGPASRLTLAESFGVQETIDIGEMTSPNERIAAIRELTGGIGADVVVDCTGVPSAVPEGLDMLRHGGVYVEIGHYTDAGSTTINPFQHLCYKDVTLIGQWAYGSTQFRKDLALLERHHEAFPFGELITHRFRLDQYAEAMDAVKEETCMKAVFAP